MGEGLSCSRSVITYTSYTLQNQFTSHSVSWGEDAFTRLETNDGILDTVQWKLQVSHIQELANTSKIHDWVTKDI